MIICPCRIRRICLQLRHGQIRLLTLLLFLSPQLHTVIQGPHQHDIHIPLGPIIDQTQVSAILRHQIIGYLLVRLFIFADHITKIRGQLEIQRIFRSHIHLLKVDVRPGLVDLFMQIKGHTVRVLTVKYDHLIRAVQTIDSIQPLGIHIFKIDYIYIHKLFLPHIWTLT